MPDREWLKAARNGLGLSQSQVADRAGIVRPAYSMIESGKRNPSVDVAKRISKIMQLDWTVFFAHEETNRDTTSNDS